MCVCVCKRERKYMTNRECERYVVKYINTAVRQREGVCVRERERECVSERERDRERECVCMHEERKRQR